MKKVLEKVSAREILDSRGHITVEVDIHTIFGVFRSSCPSGKSTGSLEAKFLKGGNSIFKTIGCQDAVNNVLMLGKDLEDKFFTDIESLDSELRKHDPSDTLEKLGTNALLPLSMCFFRMFAFMNKQPLVDYISIETKRPIKFPRVFFNLINGGLHSGNLFAFQEIMVSLPGKMFKDVLAKMLKFNNRLKNILAETYKTSNIPKGDEGGFSPNISTLEEGLEFIEKTIETTGFSDVEIAIDCAANNFKKNDKYCFRRKIVNEIKQVEYSTMELCDYYKEILKKHKHIKILEDPFEETDLEGWKEITKQGVLVIGDDLLVTNKERIKNAAKEKICNAVLIKPNQVGTITGTLDSIKMAYEQNMKVMVSHRSGETEDTFIADLSVGIGADYLKTGAPYGGERVSKYNQLLRLEELLDERDASEK